MKNINDLVGKTYAAKGAFTQIKTDNCLPNHNLGFEATNNTLETCIYGFLFDFNREIDVVPDYRIQLTKLKYKDHIIDLCSIRSDIKKEIKEQTLKGESYTIFADKPPILETYFGVMIQNVPILKRITIGKEGHEQAMQFDLVTIISSLEKGFYNIIYEKQENKMPTEGTKLEATTYHNEKKSINKGFFDGEFVTKDMQENEESPKKRKYTSLNSKQSHIRAGHNRNCRNDDGSIKQIGIAPHAVKPNTIPQEIKDKYYLGPNAQISQETMLLTDKRGSLDFQTVKLLIETLSIPTYKEFKNK